MRYLKAELFRREFRIDPTRWAIAGGWHRSGKSHMCRPAQLRTRNAWFNPCAFVFGPGQFGNMGRNGLNAPPYTNVDLSLLKDLPLHETRKLQFRAEAYNLFNHTDLNIPNHTL